MKLYHFIPTWINPIGNPWKYPPLDSPEKILPTPIHTILRHLFFSLRRARRGVYDVKSAVSCLLKDPCRFVSRGCQTHCIHSCNPLSLHRKLTQNPFVFRACCSGQVVLSSFLLPFTYRLGCYLLRCERGTPSCPFYSLALTRSIICKINPKYERKLTNAILDKRPTLVFCAKVS